VLERVLENQRNRRKELASVNREQPKRAPDLFLGTSDAILRLEEQATRAAGAESPILITGETGTGKSELARWLHRHSQRASESLLELNCGGFTREFLETELFGHEKGAFTGALTQKKGRFDLADGGTLFLDEIGDMSLRTQAKILRILQERCFERVGGTRLVPVDVRIIAATNKMLQEEIQSGRFREDLYYRLNVVPFRVSALRERIGDIALLVTHFVGQFYRSEGLEPKTFLKETLELLSRYDWPGNVRELKNIVERILIMTPGRMITPEDIPSLSGERARPAEFEARLDGSGSQGTLREAREGFERDFIIQKLEENDWNISRTAEIIELERSNLHRKIKSYGIDIKK